MSEKNKKNISEQGSNAIDNQELERVAEIEDSVEEIIKESKSKKKKPGKFSSKLKNKKAFKRNTLMIILAVVFAAVLILVNVLSVVIAQRFPTTWDVTTDKSNSISDDNIEFIQGVENEVEIIVCATREDYTGSNMVSYALQAYYVQENSTPDNYFNQTVILIENYPKYNNKISVKYVDTQSPTFDLLEQESNLSVSYGDILVRCTREIDGKETTNTSIITFSDIYELYDASGYAAYGSGYYTITSSNIETELSSAIYTVATSNRATLALLKEHSASGAADYLTQSLEEYNFSLTEIEGIVSEDKLKDVDGILLVEPTSDLNAEELRVIDAFLQNDGKYGKSFLAFGNPNAPATPNLDQFMEEWGIVVEDGIAFETNSQYVSDDLTMVFNAEDDITKQINSSSNAYYVRGSLALAQGYETSGARTSHILMTTSESAVVAPKGTESGYTPPSNAEKGEIPIVIVTEETGQDENYNDISSYVGYFGCSDLISADWAYYESTGVGNMEYALTVANAVNGRADMYFIPKITGTSYIGVSDSQKGVISVMTIYVLPILVLAGGVFIWIWRKNR